MLPEPPFGPKKPNIICGTTHFLLAFCGALYYNVPDYNYGEKTDAVKQ